MNIQFTGENILIRYLGHLDGNNLIIARRFTMHSRLINFSDVKLIKAPTSDSKKMPSIVL